MRSTAAEEAFACVEHYCKRLARLAGTMGFLARSTLGVAVAPNALAEVGGTYQASIVGKSLWHFQPIDRKYRLVAALAATPVYFLSICRLSYFP